ncbi:hypothetical protein V6Z11_A11G231400 [Gossypium hirsutum]
MEDPSSFFFQKGFSSSQSLRLCPILPHPKQKTGNFSYLKDIHDLFLSSIETKIPLSRGFCTSKFIFK